MDGGLTWTQTTIDLGDCGDPWLSMTPDGRAVLTVLGKTGTSNLTHAPAGVLVPGWRPDVE
jgi:hypothetical protein